MLTKTLSEAKKKQRNILIKAMNNDIGSIDSAKDSWNPAQISERAKDISYIRILVDTWNPAQLNEALQMLDLPVIDTWNPAQIEEQRKNLVFYLAERTLTGNPITLNILGKLTPEVTGLKVTMNPIQDLSHGEPSPTNICPISGRTEVSIKRTGKNIFDKTQKNTSNGYVDNSYLFTDGAISSNNNYYISEYLEIEPNTDYSISGLRGDRVFACWYDAEKTYIGQQRYSNNESRTFTTPSNAYYLRISVYKDNEDITQLESGTTVTAYEPYTAETHTHQYSDTIYGGTDDFVNGGATSEFGFVEYDGTENWTLTGGSFRIAKPEGIVSNNKAISNMYLRASSSTVTDDGYFFIGGTNLVFYNSQYSTLQEWTTALSTNHIQVCYELATPTTISTSAEEITLLKGTNVLSTDGDSIELKYKQNF